MNRPYSGAALYKSPSPFAAAKSRRSHSFATPSGCLIPPPDPIGTLAAAGARAMPPLSSLSSPLPPPSPVPVPRHHSPPRALLPSPFVGARATPPLCCRSPGRNPSRRREPDLHSAAHPRAPPRARRVWPRTSVVHELFFGASTSSSSASSATCFRPCASPCAPPCQNPRRRRGPKIHARPPARR